MPKTSYRIVPGLLQVFGKESTVDGFTLWKDNHIPVSYDVYVSLMLLVRLGWGIKLVWEEDHHFFSDTVCLEVCGHVHLLTIS